MIKSFVSGDRSRFRNFDYNLDLDLSYITPRIIAMSLPSDTLIESTYRNSLDELVRFFRLYHQYPHFLVINLSQKRYPYDKLDNMVLEFGWKDHHSPPLKILFQACKACTSWLNSDEANVVSIHCKAGKGRTGTLVSAVLMFSGECHSAKDALEKFAKARMPGASKENSGVTMPSQIRYVEYFERIVLQGFTPHDKSIVLKKLIISGAPIIDGSEMSPVIRVYFENEELLLEKRDFHALSEPSSSNLKIRGNSAERIGRPLKLRLDIGLEMKGDITIQIWHEGIWSDAYLGRTAFHTGFIGGDKWIKLDKYDLDDACKNRIIPDDFSVHLFFEESKGNNATKKMKRKNVLGEEYWSGIDFVRFQEEAKENQSRKKVQPTGTQLTNLDSPAKSKASETSDAGTTVAISSISSTKANPASSPVESRISSSNSLRMTNTLLVQYPRFEIKQEVEEEEDDEDELVIDGKRKSSQC